MSRSGLSWFSDWAAYKASAQTKAELRSAAAHKVTQLGPIWVSGTRGSTIATTLMRGLDSLDIYFARYLPQLILAVTIPLSVGIAILTQDLLSAIIVALTVPLIPFFMALIGWFTQTQVEKQWVALQRLAGHFLDLIDGLPTLKAFNRSRGQRQGLIASGDEYRTSTMSVLRISFLSSLVLELLSTISVALVAVSIGLRLVDGKMGLREGLIVLILIPDVYLPLRNLGAQFHSMTEGLEAANTVLEILEEPGLEHFGSAVINKPKYISFNNVSVVYPGYAEPGLSDFTATFLRGQLNVITGPSGVGKSSALNALMGFVSPAQGSLLVNDQEISLLDLNTWRNMIAYLPQNPWLPIGSLRNIFTSIGAFSDDQIISTCKRVGLDLSDQKEFPYGLDTTINVLQGVSTGQRRRLAFARTLLLDRDIVILDEPSAAVDARTEAILTRVISELVSDNKFVIVVAHRPEMIAAGTHVVRLCEPVNSQ